MVYLWAAVIDSLLNLHFSCPVLLSEKEMVGFDHFKERLRLNSVSASEINIVSVYKYAYPYNSSSDKANIISAFAHTSIHLFR